MLNPSFEEAALAGWPDYWAFYVPGLKPDQRIGREHAVAGLDPDRPWHGAVSLRLSGTVWPRITLAPQHDRPTPYVWSAWMRADRDGFQVRWLGLDGVNLRERFFTLTPEWKRYDWPLTVPASVTQYAMYSIEAWGPSKQDGRFWVDAMQFEQGTAPTAFEP